MNEIGDIRSQMILGYYQNGSEYMQTGPVVFNRFDDKLYMLKLFIEEFETYSRENNFALIITTNNHEQFYSPKIDFVSLNKIDLSIFVRCLPVKLVMDLEIKSISLLNHSGIELSEKYIPSYTFMKDNWYRLSFCTELNSG